ncbi:hypothetical protein BJ170DRAFT_594372 [Xylariales sp. AK1849]|nr:hypothetical protein BJ170DRAFT_594372 [Xylariales sp. AK1849]
MSSFMKKTGGLSFKPKGGRRAGAASASQAPTPASAATTRAPTAEPAAQSQSQAPTPTPIPALAVTVKPPATQAPKQPPIDPSKHAQEDTSKEIPRDATTEATHPSKSPPSAAPNTVRPTPEPGVVSNGRPPTPRIHAETVVAPAITTVSVSTPAASPAPTPAPTLPSISGASIAKETGLRPSLPRATPALAAPSLATTPARKEASVSAASIGLPSPAASAIRPPVGRALLSPSPFPISDSITAVPPPDEPPTNDTAQTGPASGASKPKRRYVRKRKEPEEGAGVDNAEASSMAPKPKRQRKKKAPMAEARNGETAPDGEAAASAPKPQYRHRRRNPTPEDAENQTIDHTKTTIGELTRDLGIGKKFKHADLIVERQRLARHEQKMRKLEKQKRAVGQLPAEENNEEESRAGTPGESTVGTPVPTAPALSRTQGVAFDIIDGKIVVNQSSLVIDQGAEERTVEMETVEEDEFTHLTTSATYMRASRQMGTNHWSDEETERFYHYLKMFGTDFETISHVFPGKNRRMVKLKFNREEKLRPNRVNAAIMARGQKKVAIDLEDYKANRLSGDSWISKDKFQTETEERKREMERQLEEKRQERRDLGLLDDDPAAPAPAKETGADGAEEGEKDGKGKGEGEEGEEVEEAEEVIENAGPGAATASIEA